MAERYIGTCTECGEENVEVTLIDDVTSLCDDCIEELDYIECDCCHEFWRWDALKFYNLKDGRGLCEHCGKRLIEDGEVTEDEIESVNDYSV